MLKILGKAYSVPRDQTRGGGTCGQGSDFGAGNVDQEGRGQPGCPAKQIRALLVLLLPRRDSLGGAGF